MSEFDEQHCDHDYEPQHCDHCGKYQGMVCNHCGDWYDGGDHMAAQEDIWCACHPERAHDPDDDYEELPMHYAYLKPGSPFDHIFPGGRVPIRSPLQIVPRETGAPLCYLVPGDRLTEAQIAQLAALLFEQWRPECASVEEAAAYIRSDALPLRVDWFQPRVVWIARGLALAPSGGADDDPGGRVGAL